MNRHKNKRAGIGGKFGGQDGFQKQASVSSRFVVSAGDQNLGMLTCTGEQV